MEALTTAQEWLTPAQAANRLGISGQRVRQLMTEGRLDYQHTPLGRLIDAASVTREVQRRMAAQPAGRRAAHGLN